MNWLTEQLNDQHIEANAPQFPDPKNPVISDWLKTFGDAIGVPDDQLVLVGHSLGCSIILKYLSNLETDTTIAGIVLVAGMASTESWKPEGLYPLDFERVKTAARKRICIYSGDDDKVLPERTKELAKLIDAELILDAGKGHFVGYHGCLELPSVLGSILSCYTPQ